MNYEQKTNQTVVNLTWKYVLRESLTPFKNNTKSTQRQRPLDVLDWQPEHEEAFTDLKWKLSSAPCLGLLDPSKHFHVQVDTVDNTLNGVLAQEHGGKLRPIACYSRKKSPVKPGFDQCTQHILAVQWMLTTESVVAIEGQGLTSQKTLQCMRNTMELWTSWRSKWHSLE
uniref:Reverse transcriptase/retrotransposon-derived protein RNase H-like domain-containing protein n=1 Tax=Esox lucius TaxID=8010 RepID=A0A3P9A940_ESOLU